VTYYFKYLTHTYLVDSNCVFDFRADVEIIMFEKYDPTCFVRVTLDFRCTVSNEQDLIWSRTVAHLKATMTSIEMMVLALFGEIYSKTLFAPTCHMCDPKRARWSHQTHVQKVVNWDKSWEIENNNWLHQRIPTRRYYCTAYLSLSHARCIPNIERQVELQNLLIWF
jgi:hypothetical protein